MSAGLDLVGLLWGCGRRKWVVREGMVARKKKDCEGVLETIVLKGWGGGA